MPPYLPLPLPLPLPPQYTFFDFTPSLSLYIYTHILAEGEDEAQEEDTESVMMQEENYEQLVCPSFSTYSSNKLAETAIRVGEEFTRPPFNQTSIDGVFVEDEEDDDFEFALLRPDLDSSTSSTSIRADREGLGDGQIRPIFPMFNRDLLLDDGELNSGDVAEKRIPLRNLFIEERDHPSSSSSSEADELERLTPGTYCVWKPKATEASPSGCKKSNSTGSSSKRLWRFRDLLRRSNSDGRDPIVFSMPDPTIKKSERTDQKEKRSSGEVLKVSAGKSKVNEVAAGKKVSSAHEMFYVRSRALKEGDKRRSYLPYKQDIVGLFANNVVGLSLTKNFHPF